jgi:hypothetical protein
MSLALFLFLEIFTVYNNGKNIKINSFNFMKALNILLANMYLWKFFLCYITVHIFFKLYFKF